MKPIHAYLILLSCVFFSCEKDASSDVNYLTDITIENNKLRCDGIVMQNHTGIINTSEFTYGEKITLLYDNMTGFALQDSLGYPEIDILVLNKKGDTMLFQKELLKNITKGYTEEELNLTSNMTFAKPMLPKNSYEMNVHIRDKHSDAFFILKKDFKIVPNPLLNVEAKNLTYDILYLFSQTRNLAIVDNKVAPNENMYILLENLEGYEVNADGKVNLQGSISLVDADGKVIREQKGLFPDPVDAKDLKDQLYASFSVTEGLVSNPVTCTFEVIDTNTNHSFKVSLDFIVEELKNEPASMSE
ncbi:hypothetical protein [Kordia jejudonensis]|uniref:hypothetical protein n=1 Tax=Kordia jejudonensis TaxID=1348245 RepID=UPI0012E03E8A|nr:hypothetical protein [Kordia jejudonensis]